MSDTPPAGMEELVKSAPAISGNEKAGSPPPGMEEHVAPQLNEIRYGTVGQQVKAGAEGFLRGATLGGSDIAETKLGIATPEAVKGRMEENPATGFISSGLGGAALIAGTGGLAAPAEALAGGAGLGATALAGAGEGALFGAGSSVTDYALGDPNLNAEKVLTNIGLGSVLGVGANLLGHGIESMIGKSGAVKGTAAEAIKDEIESGNRAAETVDKLSTTEGIEPDNEKLMKAAQDLDLPVYNGMVTQDQWIKRAEDALINGAPTYSGIKRQKLYQQAHDSVNKIIQDLVPESPYTQATAGQAVQDGLIQKISAERDPINELYSTIKETTKDVPLSDRSAPAIARNILAMPEVTQTPNSPQARLARSVAENILNAKTVEDIAFQKTAVKGMANSTIPAERRIAAILTDKLNEWEESSVRRYANRLASNLSKQDAETQANMQSVVDRIQNLLPQIKEAKAKYAPFIEDVKKLAGELGKSKIHGPQDALDFIQGLDFEQLTNRLTKKGNSQFRTWFAEKFPQEMSVLREYQKNALREAASKTGEFSPKMFFNRLDNLEPEIQKSIFFPEELKKLKNAQTYFQKFPKAFNPSGTDHTSAFRGFFESPTGAAIGNARDLAIEGYIHTFGKIPEGLRPPAAEVGMRAADRFNHLNATQKIINDTDKRIQNGILSIIGKAPIGTVPAALNLNHSYDQKVDRIKELSMNSDAMSAQLQNHVNGVSDHLPNISSGITTSVAARVNFLNSKIPRPATDLPLQKEWRPSLAQKQKFEKYYDIANDPLLSLKQIKHGKLTLQTMETLNATNPSLLKELRRTMVLQIPPESAKKLHLKVRNSLSVFVGQPLEVGQLQPVMAANQLVFKNQAGAQQQQAQQNKWSASAIENIETGDRLTTEIAKEEMGNVKQ